MLGEKRKEKKVGGKVLWETVAERLQILNSVPSELWRQFFLLVT